MAGLLFLESITLRTKIVNFGVHPAEEKLGRGRRYPGPLQLGDFLALASHLDAHVLDFASDKIEVGQVLLFGMDLYLIRTDHERRIKPL